MLFRSVSGGVAEAVVNNIKKIDPDREVKVASAQGLQDCYQMLKLAQTGKYDGYLLEGMGCPGGCVAGAGTLQSVNKSTAMVGIYKKNAPIKNSLDTEYKDYLEKLD